MNINQKRLIKLVTLLLMIFFAFFLKKQLPEWNKKESGQPFSAVKKNSIGEIRLYNKTTSVIYKKNNKWYIKKNSYEFRADQERIDKIIDSFINLKKENTVSNNKNKHQQLGIDKQKVELKINNEIKVLFIGDSNNLAGNYVRIDNQDEVFTAEGFNDIFLSDDYRDLSLHFLQDETKATNLEIGNIKLEKNNNEWKIGDKTAKKDRVSFYLNDLKTLKASDMLPANTTLPTLSDLTIVLNEGRKEKILTFFAYDENNYLAKTSLSDFIYSVPTAYVASLKKEPGDFME